MDTTATAATTSTDKAAITETTHATSTATVTSTNAPPSSSSIFDIIDPITQQPLAPPPHTHALHILDTHTNLVVELTAEEKDDIYGLCMYYPTLLQSCSTYKDRQMIIIKYYIEVVVSLVLCICGVWQVRMI